MKTHFVAMLPILVTIIAMQGFLTIFHAQASNSTGNVSNMTNAENASAGNETALAESNVTVTVTPFAQVPGRAVLVEANGLAPHSNATILVDNAIAARSETDENGTLFYALGVVDQITITEIRVDNSTGEESINEITHSWEGTVSVVVRDQFENTGSGELTVIRPVGQPSATANVSNATGNATTRP